MKHEKIGSHHLEVLQALDLVALQPAKLPLRQR
jgi:hypothetical protein